MGAKRCLSGVFDDDEGAMIPKCVYVLEGIEFSAWDPRADFEGLLTRMTITVTKDWCDVHGLAIVC